jgi:hypothetical protein
MNFAHVTWIVVRFLDVSGFALALLGGAIFAHGAIQYLLRHNLSPQGALPSALWRLPAVILGKRIFLCGLALAVSMFAVRLVLPGAG